MKGRRLNGFESLKRIASIVDVTRETVEALPREEALSRLNRLYVNFPKVVEGIAEAFLNERFLDVYFRLKIELQLVEKSNPPVRPALDPEFALRLRLYSLDDAEVGRFLGYPECCIRSFVEDLRLSFDEEHLRELCELRRRGFRVIATAGFIPCSLNCSEAMKQGLLTHVEDDSKIRLLDDELKKNLPHPHPAYPNFFEYLY
ncbi:MAG: DUF483 domain-containing protein [Candidatus Nezhaarchaeota archaeon]|nr:DUF483 domain-containing protein [Candidatus Nezhaarchaeota archaeon]